MRFDAQSSRGASADVMTRVEGSKCGGGPMCNPQTRRRGGLARTLGVLLASAIGTSACAADQFRFHRMTEKDGVLLRDLDAFIADANGGMDVQQVSYDFAAERDEYRLGNNDVLDIFVMNHPELSSHRVELGQTSGTTIRKDGHVHLPVVGAIAAAGLTLTEFETALREAVARYVVEPQVTVEILRYESQKFHVLGQVRQPGTFAVDGDTTLLEALTLAGGAGEQADLETATVVRQGQLLPIDLGDLLRRGDTSRNVFMRAGDVVFVPDNSDRKVFVLGEVMQPRVVAMSPSGLTLAEALAQAGGPTAARARRELAVIRGGFAKPVVYRIELEDALLVDEQIRLRPGDRIIVAPTGLSTASRYMQQILPFLLGAQALGLAAQGGAGVAARAATAAASVSNP